MDVVEHTQVDPAVGANDTGNFLFLNLATLDVKFRIPPNHRRRVNRERFRQMLLRDERVSSRIRWGKKLSNLAMLDDGNVGATFDDGSETVGQIVVGAEGTKSRTREFVAPETHHNHPLAVKLLGTAVTMTPDQVQPLRAIDPLLFQGCHPETKSFLWVSALDTPATNGSEGTPEEHYRMQLIVSWPILTEHDDPPLESDAERAEEMKRRATGFHPTLLSAIQAVPSDGTHPVQDVKIQDWPCLPWDNHGGAVTLVGDAAHAMTMYRGEAANHGIMDAYHLVDALKQIYSEGRDKGEVIDSYETEMRGRTSVAVEWSREACLGAHDYDGLNEKSAVLRRRAVKLPEA